MMNGSIDPHKSNSRNISFPHGNIVRWWWILKNKWNRLSIHQKEKWNKSNNYQNTCPRDPNPCLRCSTICAAERSVVSCTSGRMKKSKLQIWDIKMAKITQKYELRTMHRINFLCNNGGRGNATSRTSVPDWSFNFEFSDLLTNCNKWSNVKSSLLHDILPWK